MHNFSVVQPFCAVVCTKLCYGKSYMGPTIFWYWNSRTLKLHFQGPWILDRTLQHGQYYSNI